MSHERQYRSIGRFTAAQVRELLPGQIDPTTLGCPVALLESIMEKRAAFRARTVVVPATTRLATKAEAIAIGRSVVAQHGRPAAPKVITDADRRAQSARIGKLIEDEKTEQWLNSLWTPR